tara:strand:- start:2656 stop:2844 length:189 start_codon:yes stop_codon:yes gene_type:complete
MDCTEYIKGDSLVEVYNRVTKDGELEQIPHDMIDEVESMQYKVWSVNSTEDSTQWLGTEREK